MSRFLALLAVFALAAAPRPAAAHPHVWIEAEVRFVMEAGKLTAVKLRWVFDDFFSETVLDEFHKSKQPGFTPAELRRLEKEAFGSVAEFNFLTHLRIDGKVLKLDKVEGFTADIERRRMESQKNELKLLVYEFTVPLPDKADPASSEVALGVYDSSYYIDAVFAGKNPAAVEGTGAEKCAVKVEQDSQNPIFFGMVNPWVARLSCGK